MIEVNYLNLEENKIYNKIAEKVIKKCFEIEEIKNINLYINIVFTTLEEIKNLNNKYRKIDKSTDVLSFPMFEKNELEEIINSDKQDVLGDIVICIEQVKIQAKEYEHSFERELAYMLVHGFYHLMGYDHMVENEKQQMRKKEETVLKKLNIIR